MLLPRPADLETDEDDPRAELIRRLLEYERFKQAAEDIDALPRLERDVFVSSAGAEGLAPDRPPPDVDLREVLVALQEVMRRAEMFTHHRIERESLSLRERMSLVLGAVRPDRFTSLSELLDIREGRMGVVITFLAVLELIKASLVELVQAEPYAPIYVKAASAARDDGRDGEGELDSGDEAASYG